MIKPFILFSFFAFFFIFATWLSTKHLVILKSIDEANILISQAYTQYPSSNTDEKLIALTTAIFENFQNINPNQNIFLNLRKYVTNKRLPKFLRFEHGAIETLIKKGKCDNAARMLRFILQQEGIKSIQWNMVSPTGGHSALLVTVPDGNQTLADPFYGVITIRKNQKLIHPQDAKTHVIKGENLSHVVKSLSPKSKTDFYKDLQQINMAAEGETLSIQSEIPKLNRNSLILGKIDKSSKDVKSDSKKQRILPYWYYIGHKYNREWIRTLSAQEPVTIEATLLQKPGSLVSTIDPQPVINDKKLTWKLNKGEQITLTDAKARLSFRRLNSYIGIDKIEIKPLEQPNLN